jgi:hypothetical protein
MDQVRENCAEMNDESLRNTRETVPLEEISHEEKLNFPVMDREAHPGNMDEVIGRGKHVA